MSDVMLLGVLRMPPELWDNGAVDIAQRHARYLEAADRVERDETRIRELETTFVEIAKAFIKYGTHQSDANEICDRILCSDYPCTCGFETAYQNALRAVGHYTAEHPQDTATILPTPGKW